MKRITTEKDYEEALTQIETLMDTPEDERDSSLMERLTEMVMAYEEEHYAIEPPPVAAALQFRIDQSGLTQAAVSRLTGIQKSKISEILSGRRDPSKEQIRALHYKLGIPLHHLLGEADHCDDIEIDCSTVTEYPDVASTELRHSYNFLWNDDGINDTSCGCDEKVLVQAA